MEITVLLVLPLLHALPVVLDSSPKVVSVLLVPPTVVPVLLQTNAAIQDVMLTSLTCQLTKPVPLLSLLLPVKLTNGSKITYVPIVVKNA